MKNSKKVLQKGRKNIAGKENCHNGNFESSRAWWKQSGNLIFLKVTQVENSFEM